MSLPIKWNSALQDKLIAEVDDVAQRGSTQLDLGSWEHSMLGPAQVRAIAARAGSLGCVQELVLPVWFVQGDALAALCDVFKTMRHLRSLTLKMEEYEEPTAAMQDIAHGLTELTALEALSMDDCKITTRGALALGRSIHRLQSLVSLSLMDNSIESDGVAALLDGFRSHPILRTLRLGKNPLWSEGLTEILARKELLGTLECLDLESARIDDAGVAALAQASASMPVLRELNLKSQRITDAGVEPMLSALLREPWDSSLRKLALGDNRLQRVWKELRWSEDAEGWREFARARRQRLTDDGAGAGDKTARRLSLDAEHLLETLVRLRKFAESSRDPMNAWRSKSDWFDQARMDRHRENADALISELVVRGAVEVRELPSGKQRRYRAHESAEALMQKPQAT